MKLTKNIDAEIKINEKVSSRRKFITAGASTAAVLLSGAAIAKQAETRNIHAQINKTTHSHNNVEQMKFDTSLKQGDIVYTLGYHQAGDDGNNVYTIIKDTGQLVDGGSIISLNSHGLKAQGVFPDAVIRVEQFGAIGFSSLDKNQTKVDNTQTMRNAHNLGKVIHYGAKQYNFTHLDIISGGIIGRGEATVLNSTDSSSKNLIEYLALDKSGLGVNELNAIFKDFSLQIKTKNQKRSGAGIKLNPTKSIANYSAQIDNVSISNLPISIHTNNRIFYTVKNSYLNEYSTTGIYMDYSEGLEEIKDSDIENNVFYTEQAKASAVQYHGGGISISNNKFTGGMVAVALSPQSDDPIVKITGNYFDQQSKNCIRLITENKLYSREPYDFGQILISQNRINASHTEGAAIYVAPSHFNLEDLSINNNLIRFNGNDQAIAAIDINNTSHFMINNNTINCNAGKGYRGLHINKNCDSGVLSANHVILPLNGHTLNLSSTTTEV